MTPKLTNEQREALRLHAGQPVQVEDDQTLEIYLLIPEKSFPTLWEEYLRRELQIGFDAVERGDVAELDIEATIEEAKRRHHKQDG